YGATKPLMSNATEDGRSRNRRVEVVLYSPNAAPSDPEPPTAPVDAAAGDSYRVSGLGSKIQEPAAPATDKAAPIEAEANTADKPAPAPTPPVASDTPAEETQPTPGAPGQ